jgi:uncharacterized tellurite resistance protein B-like protein
MWTSTRSLADYHLFSQPTSSELRSIFMGLFDSFRANSEPEFDTQRAVMTIVISAQLADGEVDDEELARMRSMCARSPIFSNNSKQQDDRVIEFALRVMRQLGEDAVARAAVALPPPLRETAFAFAV